MNIGYLVPEFPGQTHGFFWREIQHIEKSGPAVTIFSTRRPKCNVSHAFSKIAADRTRYLADFRYREIAHWIVAVFLALKVLARRDVRQLRQEQESWAKLGVLAVIGARLKLLCADRQITHIHGHSCADAGYILAFCRLSGGPAFSLSLHGDLAIYGRGHGFKFTNAKFVACVTDALCAQVRECVPGLAQAPRLIRMGIEFDADIRNGSDWSAPHALKIVTVARLDRMKGHRHAIAAIRELRDRGIVVHYDIIGEGDHAQEIEANIRQAGLEGQVTMVGPVANDNIGRRLSAYDAFVLPSVGFGEAAPVAVMEAMSVGIPVVCSVIGGTPEMIEHERTGFLFAQGDEASLGAILAGLAEHPEIRERVGAAGRSHAHANFLTSASAADLVTCMCN